MSKKKYHLLARIMQKATFFVSFLKRIRHKKQVTERLVSTTHGLIRVIEIGFGNPETTPLYIDLHGSGFVMQRADVDTKINLYIHEKTNIKIASIDYPLSPQHPYPVANEAVYEVAQYYSQHAKELNIDKNQIGIGGHSAGGTIATTTCLRANLEKNLSFAFQILVFPVTDLSMDVHARPKHRQALPPSLMKLFNECYIDNDLEKAKSPDISPIYASAEQLKGQPPVLLIVAGKDSLHDEGLRYADLLSSSGVSVEVHDFKNSIHGFTQYSKPDAMEAYDLMANFIRQRTT